MTSIGVHELARHVSAYVALARAGETVEITDQGQQVAMLTPGNPTGDILDRLVAEGRATPASADSTSLPPFLRQATR